MVSINYSAREVCCKIVYYGPGLSGKTTNLQYVHTKVPNTTRGDLISLATEADRTLYFDFLPINIGTINGFQAKFQLYTVPGQVYYNATRKLVLRGVDGVVFVADSQPDKMDENIESLGNLVDNLQEYGYDIDELPMVIQYNKRDLPNVLSVEEMNQRLNTRNLPTFEASATLGNGVFDTLKMIIKQVLEKAKNTAVTNRPPKSLSASGGQPTVSSAPSHSDTDPTGQNPGPSGAQSEPAQTGGTATAEQPVPLEQEERIQSYRPYPGAGRNEQTTETPTPTPTPEPNPLPDMDKPYPGMDGQNEPEIEKSPAVANDTEMESPVGHVPSMAPSLRRRGGSRKRGLFKKMFGIK